MIFWYLFNLPLHVSCQHLVSALSMLATLSYVYNLQEYFRSCSTYDWVLYDSQKIPLLVPSWYHLRYSSIFYYKLMHQTRQDCSWFQGQESDQLTAERRKTNATETQKTDIALTNESNAIYLKNDIFILTQSCTI